MISVRQGLPSVQSHGLPGLDDYPCDYWHLYREMDQLWKEWVEGRSNAKPKE